MECKAERIQSFGMDALAVLIETLWNVKKAPKGYYVDPESVLIETLWNVKMEEYGRSLPEWSVLIETLWNVNDHQSTYIRRDRKVLIETLWNVKTDTLDWFAFLLMGINRILTSCKINSRFKRMAYLCGLFKICS